MAAINNKNKYVDAITADLKSHKKHNKTTVEKLARKFGITNKNEVKEYTELAIVNIARTLAHAPNKSIKQRYDSIVQLYHSQVNLSHRTSESMRLQQYSTPAPIGYIAGIFCGFDKEPINFYFEPSAGNGLLTIAGKPKHFIVNEIDDVRNDNLKTQGYDKVMQKDASKPFDIFKFEADAIITNPPFGPLTEPEIIGTLKTKVLDHFMAGVALQAMKHNGKAAIIIGGHTTWDDKGRIQKGKNRDFFMYLYHNYNVIDVINIDGHKLYSRQGTAFNTRLILIDGRKIKPEGFAPLQQVTDVVVDTFDDLYKRVMQYVENGRYEKAASNQQPATSKPNKKQLTVTETKDVGENTLIFSIDGKEIGYVTYIYDDNASSEAIDSNLSELYLSYIEVDKKYRGNRYSDQMIDKVKNKAKQLGADVITLRIDNGCGTGLPSSDGFKKLESIYKRNGFEFNTPKEKGGMLFDVNKWQKTSQKPTLKFKLGQLVSFIGTGIVPLTGKVDTTASYPIYWIKKGKKIYKVHEKEIVPGIVLAFQVKSSGGGYKAFKSIKTANTRKEYKVVFIDKTDFTIFADDRSEAMVKAIRHRLEVESKQQPATSMPATSTQTRLRLAKAKAKAKLKLLELIKI